MSSSLLCSAESSQLVVVDLQIRLLAAMAEADRAAVVKTAETLLEAARILDVPVLYTEQYPKGLGPTVPAILEHMPPLAWAVDKTGFSCCAAAGFRDKLELAQRRQIVLLGQEAHVCILQTALELLQEGYQVFVVEDGVCSRASANKANALLRMRTAGITVTNMESVLFEWLRDAFHPQFKALSSLIA
jgi:nicotinamidase-related amidase